MSDCLTELAKSYVEKLINRIAAELRYICCFTCIAKDFEEEKTRLEPVRTTIKQRIDVAVRNGEDVTDIARFWEKEADRLIEEDTKAEQKCFFKLCPHCFSRYKRGKVLANEKEYIKKLIEDGKTLQIGLPAILPGVELHSSQNYVYFKSRESKYIELLNELKDDNNYIIGLHGMGGTGKTTLIKEVAKELVKQSSHFTYSVVTTVSSSPDIKKIQDDIAGSLGLNLDNCNGSDRPKKLWSRLTNGDKILLILDDVWGYINFDEIGIPYSDNRKGCRIVITTRDVRVCKKFVCNKTIQLDLLSEEDAWIMFKRYADLNETSNKNLLDKGRKISNECKRLPIAIAVIASSLKGEQRQDEWDMTLYSLQKHMSMPGVEDERVEIYKCLKFSYDNMKDEKEKRLFLLCSLFREDEVIHNESLARLAIGGGLFGEDYVSYENARSQVVIYKNKLVDSCLLLKVDHWGVKKHVLVKMHDLVRDAAQWIANEEIQTVQVYNTNQKAMVERKKNIKYLLCEGKAKDVFSMKLDDSKLEVLIVIMYQSENSHTLMGIEVPDTFFENINGLRFFQITGYNFFGTLSLPQSMQSLKNIRSIILEYIFLWDISILENLRSLETLDLVGCVINELPHGITKLEKLRLLKLERCQILRNNPFEVIGKCSSLEELYFIQSFNEFCREINFPKLQRFHVYHFYAFNDDSWSKYVSTEYRDDTFLSETTLKYCMQEADSLKLKRIQGEWRNIIPEIIPLEHGMNDLVELSLSCISQFKCLIDIRHTYSPVSDVFSKLVVLTLKNMENLEELYNGPLSLNCFKSLEKLFVNDCKHIRSLFKCNLNLCNLKEVSLVGCPMLISIFELSTACNLELLDITDCEHLEYIIVDDDSKSRDQMFLKLKFLKIEKCPKFEIILPFVSADDLPALESIILRSCDKVEYIFGQDVKLGSLKFMELQCVPNLIDIFPECSPTKSLSIKRSSSMPPTQSDHIKCNFFSLTDIYCCGKKLRSTTSTKISLVNENQPQKKLMESNSYCLDINTWKRVQCLSKQTMFLCNVKEIELTQLKKIKSVFILSIAPKMLLETLTIKNCDELKHIIIDTGDHDIADGNNLCNVVFPNLKRISIEDCRQLEYIFGHCIDDLQNDTEIQLHLSTLECFYLSNLPSLVAMCPKQYHITCSPLKELVLNNCLQVANMKPIGDFIPHHLVSRSIHGIVMKELSGSMESLLTLERLVINKSNVKSIVCLNEVKEQVVNLDLKHIDLEDVYVMLCPFLGFKNSCSLLNLTKVEIVRCEKLEMIFSNSILKYIPQLIYLKINECGELQHIIEDDLENQNVSNSSSSGTCFPKLIVLIIEKCNKLKYVFPNSICKEFPELQVLIIREADELEEIFKTCEGKRIEKVHTPNLKFVTIVNLPSFFQTQGILFQTVQYRLVKDCHELSLTSTSIPGFFDIFSNSDFISENDYLYDLFNRLINEYESYKERESFPSKIDDEATSEYELTYPQIGDDFVEEVPNLEIPSVAILPSNFEELMNQQQSLGESHTILETKNESPVAPKQKGTEILVDEGTTSINAKTGTSLTHSKSLRSSSGPLVTSERKTSPQEHDPGQIDLPSFSHSTTGPLTLEDVDLGDSRETSQTNNQVSLNDDHALMKVSSLIEEQIPNDNEIIVSKSKLSSFASQFPSTPSQGDSSEEDFSSTLLVPEELEQLVLKKHLHHENLSLLTDFLVKHPSVFLRDTSLSNRYKGCAYNFLAELLKFLQTHSVLDVLGSSHSEFVELLQDARRFPFDKEWLDVIEKRVLFPGLQVSQAALQKLLDSKHILTEHVKDLKHQLASSEAVLESITQQEAQILETRATLSHPIGY
ncbi:uncharacterized protein LOC131640805 [Vicia villosa]|uniref:uncharacterized protein LOC131640805 n=1 Tax=Vicia villosa TaxID=3911 RepID=UPI00273C6A43|nr:uncharacterized protein LOC131640805 [Vicia villosa]